MQVRDIGVLLPNQAADAPQNAILIRNRNIQRHIVDRRMAAFGPMQINPPVRCRIIRRQRPAIDGMQDRPLAGIGDADDPLARHRLTTLRPERACARRQPDHGACLLDDRALGAIGQFRVKLLHDRARTQLRRPDPRQNLALVLQRQRLGRRGQRLIGGLLSKLLKRHPRQFASQLDVAVAVHLAQRSPDRRLRAPGRGNVDPGGLRRLSFGGDDIYRLPVLQPRPKRHPNAIHLGPHARMPDPRVDRIGQINRRRPARQLHNIAFGRETEDLIGIHLKLDVLEEFVVILRILEPFGQALQPLRGIDRKGVLGPHAIAVGPVCCNACLGHFVHLPGADLHLHSLAVATADRRVDRAIAVRFRLADVILEPPRNRFPTLVNRAEHTVAIILGLGNHTEPVDVGQPAKGQLLVLHLSPDRIGLFRPPIDLRLDPVLFQNRINVVGDLRDHIAGFALQRDEPAQDRGACFRVHHPKRQVLQLFAHPMHTHPAGKRRKDIHRLLRLLALLLGAHVPDGAHVVQPVGQLHQDHPQVLGHRHEQFAEVLGLLALAIAQLQVRQLRDAIHKLRDLIAELLRNLAVGRAGVFNRVVEKCRYDRCVIKLLLRKDRSDGNRMGEIRLTGMTRLPLVHVAPIGKGAADQRLVGVWVVGLNEAKQIIGVDRINGAGGMIERSPRVHF